MKLASARAWPVRLRFHRPVRTARGEFHERTVVLLELRDPSGITGYGEAAPWPGFTRETPDECGAALREAEAMLAGVELGPGEWTPTLERHLARLPAARTAVQGALWDLEARRAGRTLADCLAAIQSPPDRPALARVGVSALLSGDDPPEIHRQAVLARAGGFRAVKLKLGGREPSIDVARSRAVRDAVGPDVELRGDANGAWNLDEALSVLDALEPCGFAYVEQPLEARDDDDLPELRRRSPIRVALDESVVDENSLRRLLEARAADVVVLKPALLGGPERALALAALARSAGVDAVFSHAFESAVGAHHALHCAAAWGDGAALHGLCTAGLFVADLASPVECRGGWAGVPAAPGIGVAP